MTTTTWFVLCNAARARIFERKGPHAELLEVADLLHPQSRLKGIDVDSDRPGKVMHSIGDGASGSTAFVPHSDPLRKQHQLFARQVAGYVDRAVKAGTCDALLLVASNPFLGELKSQLSLECERALRGTLPMDLTALPLPELVRRLGAL